MGTLVVLLLGWLCWGQWRLADRVERLAETKLDKADHHACQKGCALEVEDIWKRVNRHGHTKEGQVIISA